MTYPTPKKYPVSVKSFDILNSENKIDSIQTFYDKESFDQWISQVKSWDELSPKKSKIEILDTLEIETRIINIKS